MDRVRVSYPQSPCRITNKDVAGWPLMEGGGQTYLYDERDTRFGVCVGKTRKSFFVEASVRGMNDTKRVTIGRFGDYTVDEARTEGMKLLVKMAQGIDPIAEKDAERKRLDEEKRATKTLQEVWDFFKDEKLSKGRLKPGTIRDYEKYLKNVFNGKQARYPNWLDRPIKDITSEKVEALHRYIGKEREKPGYANGAMRVLSSVIEFAKAQGFLKDNPVDVIRQKDLWYPDKRRQTFVRPHQLPAWFDALEKVRNDPEGTSSCKVGCDYLEFLLFLGLRREEAATLMWDNVFLESRVLHIPGEKTKNGLDHVLPLTDHLVTLLQRRKEAAGDSPWVFAATGRNKGSGHISEPRYIADKVTAICGIPFLIHDLRRTFITLAESLDIPYYALKRLVNHRMSGDVTAGYIVFDAERLRAPMEKITNELLQRAKAPDNHVLKIA